MSKVIPVKVDANKKATKNKAIAQIIGAEGLDPIVKITAATVSSLVNLDQNNNNIIEVNEVFAGLQGVVTVVLIQYPEISREELNTSLEFLKANPAKIVELVKEYNELQDFNNDIIEGLVEDTLLWVGSGVSLFFRYKETLSLKEG